MIRFLLHSYGEFSPQLPLKPSVWAHFDLLYVHEGRLDLRIKGRGKVSLAAGEGVLLFPHTSFLPCDQKFHARASVQHFSLDEEGDLPAPFDTLSGKTHAAILRQGPRNKQLESDIDRALTLAVAEESPMLQLMREALLTLILGEFLIKPLPDPSTDRRVSTLMTWAGSQPVGELKVSKLAEKAGLSNSGLRRRFISEAGITPNEFLLRLRVNEACRLLRETALPVKEIASRLGYSSAVSFHAAFRAARAETPMSYRRSSRTAG